MIYISFFFRSCSSPEYLCDLYKNNDGATAIEYGLVAALIAIASITALGGVGNSLDNTFSTVNEAMEGAGPPDEPGVQSSSP